MWSEVDTKQETEKWLIIREWRWVALWWLRSWKSCLWWRSEAKMRNKIRVRPEAWKCPGGARQLRPLPNKLAKSSPCEEQTLELFFGDTNNVKIFWLTIFISVEQSLNRWLLSGKVADGRSVVVWSSGWRWGRRFTYGLMEHDKWNIQFRKHRHIVNFKNTPEKLERTPMAAMVNSPFGDGKWYGLP